MEVGSIFLILALVLIVGLFVGRPFLSANPNQEPDAASVIDSADHQRSSLLAERDRMLTALQELDFDHRLEKIPEEDYPVMRADLVQAAAQVLRSLDQIQGGTQGLQSDESIEDRIEKVIAARRADAAVAKSNPLGSEAVSAAPVRVIEPPSDTLDEMIAARRRDRQEKSAGFCPHCGKPALKSDRFCSKCGAAL